MLYEIYTMDARTYAIVTLKKVEELIIEAMVQKEIYIVHRSVMHILCMPAIETVSINISA